MSLESNWNALRLQVLRFTAAAVRRSECAVFGNNAQGLIIVPVDEDIDPTDFDQVMWALSTRCNPSDDLDILRNTWSTGLDPSQYPPEARPYGSKVLINACKQHRYIKEFPPSTLPRQKTYDRVSKRWAELGFGDAPPRLNVFHKD
jgi:4-hydroxy-3-polyprenylbenzoate decarboxylase